MPAIVKVAVGGKTGSGDPWSPSVVRKSYAQKAGLDVVRHLIRVQEGEPCAFGCRDRCQSFYCAG